MVDDMADHLSGSDGVVAAGMPHATAGPDRRRRRLAFRGVLLALTVVVLATTVSCLTVRPALLDYGSTSVERSAVMPGDDLVARADTVMTPAVTLSAPPGAVWTWLVQMGVGRGGFYGYDWLENTFGDRVAKPPWVVSRIARRSR
jgi:hypothetical protein